MKCILTAGWDDGVADLTERLVRELASGKRVLWLTSGGTNIPVSVQIMDNLSPELKRNLSVMPVDERYGPPGHGDSNWAQLLQAGFNTEGTKLLPALQEGLSLEQTADRYNRLAEEAFDGHDAVIAQLGIGTDGHIAGILPNSPATAEAEALVIGYDSDPLPRLTLTFPGLRRVSASYTFAFGNTKHKALTALQAQPVAVEQQPAQILRQLPEAYVYSDQFEANS